MTPPHLLEIKTIYRASRRQRPAGRPLPRTIVDGRVGSWMLLGVVNLAVTAGLYYATWWRGDSYLYLTWTLHTPIPGVDAQAASALFFPPVKEGLAVPPSSPAPDGAAPGDAPSTEFQASPRLVGATKAAAITATMYGWLALSTVAYGLVALAAGSAFQKVGAKYLRGGIYRVAPLVWLLVLIGACVAVAWRHGASWPPSYTRFGWAAVLVLFVLLGLSVTRRTQWVHRLAGFSVIIAAMGSCAGLYVLRLCGAIEGNYSTAEFIALLCVAFAAHSLYGWLLLLPIASRIGRA